MMHHAHAATISCNAEGLDCPEQVQAVAANFNQAAVAARREAKTAGWEFLVQAGTATHRCPIHYGA